MLKFKLDPYINQINNEIKIWGPDVVDRGHMLNFQVWT